MTDTYNQLKSTKIYGTDNISGYSFDCSGSAYFHNGNVLCDGYVSSNQSTFSGNQYITRTYADSIYSSGSGLLVSNNAFLGNNTFGTSGSPSATTTTFYNNVVFSGSQITSDLTAGNLTTAGTITSPKINSTGYLALQSSGGNTIIGGNTTPSRTLEITGNLYVSSYATINGNLTVNGTGNVILGSSIIQTTGNNVAVGNNNYPRTITGNNNTSCGTYCNYSLTTGNYNIGMGYSSNPVTTTGSYNISIGYNSLKNNINGNNNISIGENSNYATTGGQNYAIGGSALYNNAGANNLAFGYQAGIFNVGSNNIYLGNNTGQTLFDSNAYNNSIAIGNSVAITKSNQINIGDATQTTTIAGNIIAPYLIPVGTIITHCFTNNITGYLLCNGQAVSRTTYVSLFNIIGTNYGAGNGSTTFNVPNYVGLFLRGQGTNSVDSRYASNANTYTLQTDAVIQHQHTAPTNPNTSYVAGSTDSSVLSSATINNPVVSLGSITVGLGSFTVLGVHIDLGSTTVPLPSITIPNVLASVYTTVLNALSYSTFATQTGNVLGASYLTTDTENRPANFAVYYHIKV